MGAVGAPVALAKGPVGVIGITLPAAAGIVLGRGASVAIGVIGIMLPTGGTDPTVALAKGPVTMPAAAALPLFSSRLSSRTPEPYAIAAVAILERGLPELRFERLERELPALRLERAPALLAALCLECLEPGLPELRFERLERDLPELRGE